MKNLLVVKTVDLISAGYKLSTLEQKILLYAICMARETETGLSETTPLVLKAADFAARFGMENTNIYNQLKTASESFFDRDLKFSTGDKLNGIDTGRVRWLSEFSYNDKQGTVKIVFTPQVIKEISRIDGRLNPYISYVLGNVCSMSNTYAIRIYEWLLAYKLVGVRELSVAWMREQLEIGDKYKEFTIFRRDVIDVAMREIGKCSDITAKYKLIKTGRSVTSIVFMFSFKQPDSVTKDKTTKRAKPKLPPPRIGESQQDYDERVRREAYEAEIKRVRESQLKNIPNK